MAVEMNRCCSSCKAYSANQGLTARKTFSEMPVKDAVTGMVMGACVDCNTAERLQ